MTLAYPGLMPGAKILRRLKAAAAERHAEQAIEVRLIRLERARAS